jgi:hypothetical protein
MYMKDKKVKQVIFSVDNTGRYEEMVKGCDVFCIHVWEYNNENCWNCSMTWEGREGEW